MTVIVRPAHDLSHVAYTKLLNALAAKLKPFSSTFVLDIHIIGSSISQTMREKAIYRISLLAFYRCNASYLCPIWNGL